MHCTLIPIHVIVHVYDPKPTNSITASLRAFALLQHVRMPTCTRFQHSLFHFNIPLHSTTLCSYTQKPVLHYAHNACTHSTIHVTHLPHSFLLSAHSGHGVATMLHTIAADMAGVAHVAEQPHHVESMEAR